MKYKILILFAILISACAGEKMKNISTTEAYLKYDHLLKNKQFFVFPEVRENPIKWFDSIPEIKLKNPFNGDSFQMNARPGEIFIFQIGIWALTNDVNDLKIEFSDLKGKVNVIKSSQMTCYNLGGTDFRGNHFEKQIAIPRGRLQDLWIGVDLDTVSAGTYRGAIAIISGKEKQVVPVSLKVSGSRVSNHGYDEGSRLARLNWLNSTVGIDEEITKGFIPVTCEGNSIAILGRTIEIAENVLPSDIQSYFGPSNQTISDKGESVINHSFRFIIEKKDGSLEKLHPGTLVFTDKTPSKVAWKVVNASADFNLEVRGEIEFDGFGEYSLKLTSKDLVKVKDIRLEISFEKGKATYMMGLGREGGFRPTEWKWMEMGCIKEPGYGLGWRCQWRTPFKVKS
jgi:hypothetical protein